jgi:hypothetical protein
MFTLTSARANGSLLRHVHSFCSTAWVTISFGPGPTNVRCATPTPSVTREPSLRRSHPPVGKVTITIACDVPAICRTSIATPGPSYGDDERLGAVCAPLTDRAAGGAPGAGVAGGGAGERHDIMPAAQIVMAKRAHQNRLHGMMHPLRAPSRPRLWISKRQSTGFYALGRRWRSRRAGIIAGGRSTVRTGSPGGPAGCFKR